MSVGIEVENASVTIPIYDGGRRSLKMHLLNRRGRITTSGSELSVRALQDINFKVGPGARVALIGDNGAGKSTLLRMISGIYHPTSGLVKTHGRISSLLDLTLGIDPEASGIDNIFMRGLLLGMPRKEIKDALPAISEFSGLGDFLEMPVRTYSSGMTLRLAFSVCTSFVPDILLMDEWLSVGDQGFAARAEARLNQILSEVPVVVLATHSIELARRVCNQGIVLREGAIVYHGDISEALLLREAGPAGAFAHGLDALQS